MRKLIPLRVGPGEILEDSKDQIVDGNIRAQAAFEGGVPFVVKNAITGKHRILVPPPAQGIKRLRLTKDRWWHELAEQTTFRVDLGVLRGSVSGYLTNSYPPSTVANYFETFTSRYGDHLLLDDKILYFSLEGDAKRLYLREQKRR